VSAGFRSYLSSGILLMQSMSGLPMFLSCKTHHDRRPGQNNILHLAFSAFCKSKFGSRAVIAMALEASTSSQTIAE
jgi:hypothetical protein